MSEVQSAAFNNLLYLKCLLEGNYAEAGRLMEQMSGRQLREEPDREERAKFDPKPYVASKQSLAGWAQFAPLAALGSTSPYDLMARTFAPSVALEGFITQVSPTEARFFPGFLTLQNRLAQFRAMQSDFFFRRGMLFVFEGDIAEAERRFLLSRLPAVEQWGLPAYHNPGAERYLEMIAEARRLAPQGK
jgi:hypothetical protein